MTLTTPNDNQPSWVDVKLGLEEYKEFKLGQKVKFHEDWVYIIHIQKYKAEEVLFRGMLPNGASITMTYDLINKPVETTNEQPNYLKSIYEELKKHNDRLVQKDIEAKNYQDFLNTLE